MPVSPLRPVKAVSLASMLAMATGGYASAQPADSENPNPVVRFTAAEEFEYEGKILSPLALCRVLDEALGRRKSTAIVLSAPADNLTVEDVLVFSGLATKHHLTIRLPDGRHLQTIVDGNDACAGLRPTTAEERRALREAKAKIPKETIKLDAEAEHARYQTIGSLASVASISASMRILSFDPGGNWAPAGFIGLRHGAAQQVALQVFAVRLKEEDEVLTVGVRVFVDGKETKRQMIENVALDAPIEVSIEFKAGLATIRVNDGAPIALETPFGEVVPYVGVSSGRAEFLVDKRSE